MSGQRRWNPTVVVLDSSDEEAEEEMEAKREEPPKRRRQAATSGRGQLHLQLSQPTASQHSEQPAASAAEQPSRRPLPAPKSGLATLMGAATSKAGSGGAPAATATAGAGVSSSAAELWVGKHGPRAEADLVVHKKKVQELRQWLEWQHESLGRPGVSRIAVVSGPPGCGKSTVVQVLAAAMGFEPCEWQPPTPTLWNEYQHQAGTGGRYISKLDAFEEFSLRAKLPALSLVPSRPATSGPSGAAGAAVPSAPPTQHPPPALQQPSQAAAGPSSSQQNGAAGAAARQGGGLGPAAAGQLPKLLIVDDLPHAANPEQRQRLAAALGDLARTTRFPLVVMATETTGTAQQEKGLSAAAGSSQGLHKDLIAALEAAQATTFSLNPITTIGVCKALKGILEKEGIGLAKEQVQAIAEQAQGDLHNAISTLQFVCTGVKPSAAPAQAARKGRAAKRKAASASGAGAGGSRAAQQEQQQQQCVGYASRDSTLTMFHALGKLLYNKRVGQLEARGSPEAQERDSKRKGASRKAPAPAAEAPAAPPCPEVAQWCRRPPMEFDPEAVLAQSGLEAGSVAAYLHENLHHFVDEAAVQDVAGCLDYLSQADCIAAAVRYGGGGVTLVDDELPSSTLAEAAAASTAARGVCFSNAHPAARRWLPLTAPAVFLSDRALRRNREQLERGVAAAWALQEGSGQLESMSIMACELLPYVRSIYGYSRDPRLLDLQPAHWCRVWNGQLYDSPAGTAGQGAGALEGAGPLDAAAAKGEARAEDAIEDSGDEEDW